MAAALGPRKNPYGADGKLIAAASPGLQLAGNTGFFKWAGSFFSSGSSLDYYTPGATPGEKLQYLQQNNKYDADVYKQYLQEQGITPRTPAEQREYDEGLQRQHETAQQLDNAGKALSDAAATPVGQAVKEAAKNVPLVGPVAAPVLDFADTTQKRLKENEERYKNADTPEDFAKAEEARMKASAGIVADGARLEGKASTAALGGLSGASPTAGKDLQKGLNKAAELEKRLDNPLDPLKEKAPGSPDKKVSALDPDTNNPLGTKEAAQLVMGGASGCTDIALVDETCPASGAGNGETAKAPPSDSTTPDSAPSASTPPDATPPDSTPPDSAPQSSDTGDPE